MRVSIIAHASVLIELGRDRILVDPIFADVFASDTLCFHPSRSLDAEALIDAATIIVVSHIHLDHFHPPTLQRFPRDLPVIVPPHDALVDAVKALGFTRVVPLEPWTRYETADGFLLATPSDFELEELGLVAVKGRDTYWHMSDAIVTEAVGKKVKEELGPVSLVSAKYQPLRTLIGYQRGLQSMMLDRDELVDTFEAACAAGPAYVFPYFSGFAFHGEHAWANRHVAPYGAAEIARLLRRRLGERVTVDTVSPGDELRIESRSITRHPGASAFARPETGPEVQCWEPIDEGTLMGLTDPQEGEWLAQALRDLLFNEVLPWVWAHLQNGTGLFDAYRDFQAVWRCTVHLGGGRRLHHSVDFRGREPQAHFDHAHPDSNVFSHISGLNLWQVLRGLKSAEVFWMAGGYRMYEKLLLVENGRFREPSLQGWELFERLPDPVTHYLRKAGRKRLSENG